MGVGAGSKPMNREWDVMMDYGKIIRGSGKAVLRTMNIRSMKAIALTDIAIRSGVIDGICKE